MSDNENNSSKNEKRRKAISTGLQIVGGAIPFAGGLFSAAASSWSEKEQDKVNGFLKHWVSMLEDELKEKEKTILEILARLDMMDEKVSERIDSNQYQSLMKKAFREWSCAESEEKRAYVRNILSNAGASQIVSDDVVRLFLEWLSIYSEMHFEVISSVYNSNGITRGQIWDKIGRGAVSENSAEADLYKLLIRDLSTGGIIRQHRPVDRYGNFQSKAPSSRRPKVSGPKPPVSAFDRNEGYELTGLGQQFVHYAMTDLPLKIEYHSETD